MTVANGLSVIAKSDQKVAGRSYTTNRIGIGEPELRIGEPVRKAGQYESSGV